MTTTPIPDPIPDPALESNLRALTTYTGEPTALWQSALDQHAARPAPRFNLKLALTLLSAAAIIVVAVGLILPSLGHSRSSAGRVAFELDSAIGADKTALVHRAATPALNGFALDTIGGEESQTRIGKSLSAAPEATKHAAPPGDITDGRPLPTDSPRSVIRKATIELAVPDTRETFAKVQHLLRADLGEFIEGSTLTGDTEPRGVSPGLDHPASTARAQLTLRVAASRLDEVLNTLRSLGKIDSENSTGDDVSATVVDLDAHLRNEKQVECEVLKLLETRKDAQLKDILELRDKLSSIRGGIESLQGRRDTLGRQISLASILILIRPDNAPKDPPKPASLFNSFSAEMSTAWTTGLTTLTDTLAFLIRIAVGGLIWWLLLIAAIATARRIIRRLIPDPAAVP